MFRQSEKGRPIRRIGIFVVGDRAISKFLLYPLNLSGAFIQALRMLLRLGPPIAEGFGRDGYERRAEERRIGDGGSPEQEKFVRTDEDEGGIAGVSSRPYPIE